MPSSYPGGLDSFATTRGDSTPQAGTHATEHNNTNDALNKIEAELGVTPKGTDASVAARLARVDSAALAALGTTPQGSDASVAARLARLDGLVFNVKNPAYSGGAKGDGTTDDVPAIQAAINAAAAAGRGILVFPDGVYNLASFVYPGGGSKWHLSVVSDNITFRGSGRGASILKTTVPTAGGAAPAILSVSGSGKTVGASNWFGHSTYDATVYTMSPAARGDTSLTCVTHSDAGNFAAGDYIFVRTGQLISGTTLPDSEINKVVTADAGTGVIQLAWPLAKPYVQEYYISGTSGPTSTSVTANLAPFGVSKVTDRVLSNITIEDLGFDSNNGVAPVSGGWVVGYNLRRCQSYSTDTGFQSQGGFRFAKIEDNICHARGSGTVVYHLTPGANGSADVDCVNNTLSGERVVQIHCHEGAANVKIEGNTIHSKASASDENPISVRARAYGLTIRANKITNSGNTAAIYVDGTCDGGGANAGVIEGNIFAGSITQSVVVAAPNWTVGYNSTKGSGSSGVGQTQFFDQSYGVVERLTNRVTPTISTSPLGTLPAFSYVTRVEYWVEEAFNSGTTDNISVGYTASQQAIANNASVHTGVFGIVTPTRNVGLVRQDRTLNAYWTGTGGAPSSGKVVVVVEYCRVRDAYA